MKNKIIRITLIILVLLGLVILILPSGKIESRVSASDSETMQEPLLESLPEAFLLQGRVEGKGTYFEIKDSQYLNITFKSSQEIKAILESIPRMISLDIEAFSVIVSTNLTVSGLEPNKTYYKYQDSYKNGAVFISNENGSYSWNQDLTQSHHIWIQEIKGTTFINKNTVLDHDITGSVEITANNITLDCNGYRIMGSRDGYGIYLNNKEDVIIKNCMVSNFSYGISLRYSNGGEINNNIAANNGYGIFLWQSSNNNTLIDNNVNLNTNYGISLRYSDNNTLTGNIMRENKYNFGVTGEYLSNYIQNIDTSNKVDGKPIYYWVNQKDKQLPSDAGFIGIVNSTNITVKELTLTNNLEGILLAFSNNIKIKNVSSSNNLYGIYLNNSTVNVLIDNTLSNNQIGLGLDRNSHENLIERNNASNNVYGISLENSSSRNIINGNEINSNYDGIFAETARINTRIINNHITLNKRNGIYLGYSSNYSTVANNNIELNKVCGIKIWQDSHSNIIKDNNLNLNQNGICLGYLTSVYHGNNKIFHNNFIDNTYQVSIQNATKVVFDNGYPEGGNYWSDYDTPEKGCVDANNDGFCDAPYKFFGGQDNYPFVKQNGWEAPPPPQSEKWSFAVITDLHIGRGYPDYNGTGYGDSGEGEDYYLTKRLNKVVSWINNNKNEIDCGGTKCSIQFLAVLGDIADSGEKSELCKAKEILDNLEIPYVLVFGNHEVCPHTDFEESISPKGEEFFDQIFWSNSSPCQNAASSKNFETIQELFSFQRNETNPKYKNFAFNYGGVNFIGLDFISREGITKGSGNIFDETENWLKERLNEYQEKEPVILFSHHPFAKPKSRVIYGIKRPGAIENFDSNEIKQIKSIVEEYEKLAEGTQILGSFAGHIHGFEKFGKEIPIIGQFSPVDLFFDANWEYPVLSTTSVITTEALMVGGNEKDLSNKGVIRIVKVNKENEIDFSDIEGKFPALNPYISFDFKILPDKIYPCVYFKSHIFSQREYSLLWDFGDGNIDYGESKTHCYSPLIAPQIYNVKLTVIDKATNEKEYITRKVEIKEGIIPKIIKITEKAKEKIELISTELGEKVTEFGRTMKDTILIKLKPHSPSPPIGLITVHFENATEDIDLSNLVADIDLAQRKSILYMPEWPKEVEESKVLFIPSIGIGSVYICPRATSLDEVNPNCENKTTLNLGDTKNGMTLSLTEYEGKEYYMIYGITGTGGGEMEKKVDLSEKIEISDMNYGGINILNCVASKVGDDNLPLLLSELKDVVDLGDCVSQENKKINPGKSKKLRIKFKFQEDAGNEYQEKGINVKFNFLATQEEQ